MAGGVLAVFAHPDDESLLAGGVLAACASAGRRVAIVSMTRRWATSAKQSCLRRRARSTLQLRSASIIQTATWQPWTRGKRRGHFLCC
jgi:GlcNAc-PI de-N-acetylase